MTNVSRSEGGDKAVSGVYRLIRGGGGKSLDVATLRICCRPPERCARCVKSGLGLALLQGLTLVKFSALRMRFLWEIGCI